MNPEMRQCAGISSDNPYVLLLQGFQLASFVEVMYCARHQRNVELSWACCAVAFNFVAKACCYFKPDPKPHADAGQQVAKWSHLLRIRSGINAAGQKWEWCRHKSAKKVKKVCQTSTSNKCNPGQRCIRHWHAATKDEATTIKAVISRYQSRGQYESEC